MEIVRVTSPGALTVALVAFDGTLPENVPSAGLEVKVVPPMTTDAADGGGASDDALKTMPFTVATGPVVPPPPPPPPPPHPDKIIAPIELQSISISTARFELLFMYAVNRIVI
jgi:hypothetical protein